MIRKLFEMINLVYSPKRTVNAANIKKTHPPTTVTLYRTKLVAMHIGLVSKLSTLYVKR